MINAISNNMLSVYNTNKQDNNTIDNQIKILQQQKSQLDDQIGKIQDEKISQKTKDDIIKSLKDQITQIDSQISQMEIQKVKGNNEADSNSNKKSISKTSKNYDNDSLIISDINRYNNIKDLINLKSSLNSSSKILKTEADLDEDRDKFHSAKVKIDKKREKASENDARVNSVTNKINRQAKTISEDIKNKNTDKKSSDNRKTAEGNNEKYNETGSSINVVV